MSDHLDLLAELRSLRGLAAEVRSLRSELHAVTAELHAGRTRAALPRYVSAAELADVFGVDRAWCYRHAAQLGACQLGDGKRGRLRFDLEVALERALEPLAAAPARAPEPTGGCVADSRPGGAIPPRLRAKSRPSGPRSSAGAVSAAVSRLDGRTDRREAA